MSRSSLSFLFVLLISARVDAHFLFIRIVPTESNGRNAEVYFSDGAEAGDPLFIGKIAGTELWTQTKPGTFTPLKIQKGEDRLTANLPKNGSLAVVGICRYGVVRRRFLLRHFPKAITGSVKDLSPMKPFDKVPLEILATVKNSKLELTALKRGKPWPNAKVATLDRKLRGGFLKCDANGKLSWTPPHKGWFMVYVSEFQKKSGKHNGTAYREIRDFATLSFQWPMK